MSSELKSAKVAEKFDIASHIQADEKSGILTLSDNFYETTLEEVGVTLDQVKKLQKHDASLLSATTLAAGEKAAELFKGNEELKEVKFEYNLGHNMASGYFEREGTTPVRNVVTQHGIGNKGELGKVYKHLKGLFNDINS